MRIVRRFIELPGQQTLSLALGNFDGIHLGHKALLKNLDTDDNHQHAVMTFEPHPLSVLRPQIKITRLYSFREKLLYLEKSAEVIYIPRFNQALAAMTAEDFVDLLFNTLNVKRVIVGENFRFGNQQHGDTEMLRRLAKPKGVTIDTIPLINIDGDSVSSGRIRQCLSEGNFTQAASLLGREWTLSGKVRKGRGLGRQLGTPTANIHLSFTPPSMFIKGMVSIVTPFGFASRLSISVSPCCWLPKRKFSPTITRLTFKVLNNKSTKSSAVIAAKA